MLRWGEGGWRSWGKWMELSVGVYYTPFFIFWFEVIVIL
jgi:hypothetical protein